MNSAEPQKGRLSLAIEIMLLVVVSIGLTGVKLVQLILFADLSTGLLRRDPLSDLLGGVVAGGVILLLILGALILRSFGKNPSAAFGGFRMSGVVLFLMAVCFIGQFLMDYTAGFDTESSGAALTIVHALLGLASGIGFLFSAFRRRPGKPRPGIAVSVLAVLWNVALVICLLYVSPEMVSLQSSMLKVLGALLTLLYLYGILRETVETQGGWGIWIYRYVQIVVPGVLLVLTLPYLLAGLFGIGDSVSSMPYLALLGVSIGAFYRLFTVVGRVLDEEDEPDGEEPLLEQAEAVDNEE